MKTVVSACLLGINCKYNGKNNLHAGVMAYVQGKDVIPLCPEQLGGLPTPRPCAEIVNGVVTDQYGKSVDAEYRLGVQRAMEQIKNEEIDLAILQSRSPCCGVRQIYDGSFSGRLIEGQGVFAKALSEAGYRVTDAAEYE